MLLWLLGLAEGFDHCWVRWNFWYLGDRPDIDRAWCQRFHWSALDLLRVWGFCGAVGVEGVGDRSSVTAHQESGNP
jgi:hypothetical protein